MVETSIHNVAEVTSRVTYQKSAHPGSTKTQVTHLAVIDNKGERFELTLFSPDDEPVVWSKRDPFIVMREQRRKTGGGQ